MMRMEITATDKEAARNRLRKYQQMMKGKGGAWHDSSKNVCRRRDTKD